MARNTKNDDNQNDINSIKFGIKDIITIITCVVSIMIGYFGIVKDIETRLVRIETRFEELSKKIYVSDNQEIEEKPIEKEEIKAPQNRLSNVEKKKENQLSKIEKIKEKPIDKIKSKEDDLDNIIMSDKPSRSYSRDDQ
jgi:cell division protein FtsI/penicillin-binding protein 2